MPIDNDFSPALEKAGRLSAGLRDIERKLKEFDDMKAEIQRLKAALKFVHADPCFKFLGTVTHDTVTDALGLTKILNEQ